MSFVPKQSELEDKKIISAGFTQAEISKLRALADASKNSMAEIVRQMVLHCLEGK